MTSVKAELVDLRDVHPFVKWAGGKKQLLPELDKMIPQFNRYFEPFLGGAALFFHMMSRDMRFTACLSDTNGELVITYNIVRDNVRSLIDVLNKHQEEYRKNPKEYYYQLRSSRPSNDVEIAARFITLNRTCFNGLYRVNKKGEFNVPIGDYHDPTICDSSNLENVSNALRYSKILAGDFVDVTENAKKGDFVYFDPPYDPVSYTSNFTAYTTNGFGRENQIQLADVFRKLADRGCLLLLSNSDTPFIRKLYS
ncbi:MAG: DNA adenine methylase, partial [Candidatus Nitrosopolaris sp.]